MDEDTHLIVKMKKITYPNGQKLTRSVVLFDANDVRAHFPEGDVINELLPKIDEEYANLIKIFHDAGSEILAEALDRFFKNVSKYAIVGGLIDVLSEDLKIDVGAVEKVLVETKWFQQVVDYIRSEFRKGKKVDPIRYAESIRQLVDIFGLNYALLLLNRKDIKMKRSTAMALCKVAGETPKIKELIRKGLKLTTAFELPSIDEEQREKIAEELLSKNYAEGKRYLKKAKTKLS